MIARQRESEPDPLDRPWSTGEEVRPRPFPRVFGPSGRGADHEAIPFRTSAGGRGLAMARDGAPSAVGARDPVNPRGRPFSARANPFVVTLRDPRRYFPNCARGAVA